MNVSIEISNPTTPFNLCYGIHHTPLGSALIATSDDFVYHLAFVADAGCDPEIQRIKSAWPLAKVSRDQKLTQPCIEKIFEPNASIPLKVHGTLFQLAVWHALLDIPRGSVTYYEAVAQSIGHPTAVRATAHCIGQNRIAYLIPCHRVISKTGRIHHYRWGTDLKRSLLEFEGLETTQQFPM